MGMIYILCKFIRAERTGNWAPHLQTIQNMLPYLAASGHNLYIKSARVYLQQMANLKEEHPDVNQCFKGGLHVIRRSDRLWVGLSSHLIIEQVMMISMKTSGGQELNRSAMTQVCGTLPQEYMPIPSSTSTQLVGAAILKSMEGKTSDEHSFIRKDQVVTLGTKSSVKIDGVEAQVDP